ncbi:MAG: hypothetical protein KIS96_12115 [Bauldia sp.]|nr:hypothetical protein [Bauldia sp.]
MAGAIASGATLILGTVQAQAADFGVPSPVYSADECVDAAWVARTGAVILTRDGPPLVPPAGQFILDNSGFGWVAGPDVYVARRIHCVHWIDVRHFSVQGWHADYLLDDGFGTVFDGSYDAGLYSTEINLRTQRSDRFAYLVGFRWIELHEQINNELSAIGFAFATSTGAHLYGGQVGVDAVLWSAGRFSVEGSAKAGVYWTHNQGHYTNTVGFDQTATERSVAFVGDLGVAGVYQATERVGVRAGYQLLWINNVALAGNQLQFSVVPPPLPLDTNGSVFAHGASLGIEINW